MSRFRLQTAADGRKELTPTPTTQLAKQIVEEDSLLLKHLLSPIWLHNESVVWGQAAVRVGEEGKRDCKSGSYKARRCQFPPHHRKGHGPNRKGLVCMLLTYVFGLLLIVQHQRSRFFIVTAAWFSHIYSRAGDPKVLYALIIHVSKWSALMK